MSWSKDKFSIFFGKQHLSVNHFKLYVLYCIEYSRIIDCAKITDFFSDLTPIQPCKYISYSVLDLDI